MSGHEHQRWRIGPFASGAYSPTGGHWKALGLMHSWIPAQYTDTKIANWKLIYELSLFGAFACRWGDGHFEWAFFSVAIKFKRARWRYGERENKRIRRESKRRYEAARKACT